MPPAQGRRPFEKEFWYFNCSLGYVNYA